MRKSENSKWRPGSSVSGPEAGRSRIFVPRPKIEAGGGSGGVVEGKATANMGEKKPPMRKNLSQDELRELSRKGLCFKCGERWGRDHVCKMKHYRVELIDEDEEEEGEEEVPVEEEEVVIESTEAFKTLLLSLRSKQGLTSNKSFKVWGVINGRRVLILIDSGATSNFICHLLVKELGLSLEETSEYTIEVGNGEKVVQKGVCAGLRVVVQDIAFTQNFYLMNLAGTELVLGMDWLASLGDIKANFQDMVIKWKSGGQQFKIRGDPSLSRHIASFRTMVKAIQHEEEGYLLQYCEPSNHSTDETCLDAAVTAVLDEFPDVFQTPRDLPPKRDQDHAIVLKPGAPTPHIRPYRYPHYQKDEIEKIVNEMLDAGIIRPSVSPFSSPVLLVKKKDGGWRLY